MKLNSIILKHRKIQNVFGSFPKGIIFVLLAILPGQALIGAESSSRHAALRPFQSQVFFQNLGDSRSEKELDKGKFLVASRELRDPNFSETVVLLVKYDQQGAMGLVINRPTQVRLSKVLPDIEGLKQRTDTIYLGGPVVRNQLLLLVKSVKRPEGSLHVFQEVYISSSLRFLQRMINEANKKERFRVFAGSAGWAPKQLEWELSKGFWHVLQADTETIFDKKPSEVWHELIRRTSIKWVQEPEILWNN